jgi:hypothetical protein
MKFIVATALVALLLAGCNATQSDFTAQASSPAPGTAVVTPPNFAMPSGAGCAGDIARYRAVQDNDLAMGHVARSVYNQIKREIAAAEQVCAAGKDREASAMIRASEKRHGYPTEL